MITPPDTPAADIRKRARIPLAVPLAAATAAASKLVQYRLHAMQRRVAGVATDREAIERAQAKRERKAARNLKNGLG